MHGNNVGPLLGDGQMSQGHEFTHQGEAVPGKRLQSFSPRHVSRKELFYQHDQQQDSTDEHITELKQPPQEVSITAQSESEPLKAPEPENTEEHIDVENCSLNGNTNGQVNGNNLSAKNVLSLAEDTLTLDASVANGDEHFVRKIAATSLKHNRRSSTSSRSSSISSAVSVKQQTTSALQMDVSNHDDLLDNMDPLLIKGSAEDLEVSTGVTIEDRVEPECEKPFTKSDEIDNDPAAEAEELGDAVHNALTHQISDSLSKADKYHLKTAAQSKVKSPKVKKTKQLSPVAADVPEDSVAAINMEEAPERKKYAKASKSPSRRTKNSASKQDGKQNDYSVEEKVETESGPRRSSRPRQTPQKYNASLFLEYSTDSLLADERMNSSDAWCGTSIRSVRGRRSLRKSRNLSALDNSLHNESSPWESDFKVLTPCSGAFSVDSSEVVDHIDSSASVKRKADNVEEDVGQDAKKICLEESVDGSTSSFFSVMTSPFTLLKSKLQRRSLSCSTPIKKEDEDVAVHSEEDAEDVQQVGSAEVPARSWCSIM